MLRVVWFQLLSGPEGSEAVVELEGRDGKIKTAKLRRSLRFYQRPAASGTPYRVLPGSIGYVGLSEIAVAQVDEMFENFRVASDDRGDPGRGG